ncbi:hypothetical protein NDA13_004341 [Ustilago tritici]|nr:hypothetical protein NDA13_004341 [Ustilago tritici]
MSGTVASLPDATGRQQQASKAAKALFLDLTLFKSMNAIYEFGEHSLSEKTVVEELVTKFADWRKKEILIFKDQKESDAQMAQHDAMIKTRNKQWGRDLRLGQNSEHSEVEDVDESHSFGRH